MKKTEIISFIDAFEKSDKYNSFQYNPSFAKDMIHAIDSCFIAKLKKYAPNAKFEKTDLFIEQTRFMHFLSKLSEKCCGIALRMTNPKNEPMFKLLLDIEKIVDVILTENLLIEDRLLCLKHIQAIIILGAEYRISKGLAAFRLQRN